MPEHPDTAWFDIAPDRVCEVLSPSARQFDPGARRAVCSRENVSRIRFVDTDARTLEAFELRKELWVLSVAPTNDAPASLPPFDAVTFPLDALWPEMAATVAGEEQDR